MEINLKCLLSVPGQFLRLIKLFDLIAIAILYYHLVN